MPEAPGPTHPPAQLDYAPAPSARRKIIRRTLSALVLIATSLASWYWGPAAWRRTQILYWQRQCMDYIAAADQVVYEEDPAAVQQLLAGDSRYHPRTVNILELDGTLKPINPVTFFTEPFERLDALAGMGASFKWAGFKSAVITFMHERVSPSGNRRLVVVVYGLPVAHKMLQTGQRAVVIAPGGPLTDPRVLFQRTRNERLGWIPANDPQTRIFAGQPDPGDASHFTIRYQMWGQEDVLDGWLKDDDTVVLEPRRALEPR